MAEEKKEPLEGMPKETGYDPETAKESGSETEAAGLHADENGAEPDIEDAAGEEADGPAGSEADGGVEASDGKNKKPEKGPRFFGKGKKEDKRDQQIAELNDKVLRQMAEFDNYRKRTEKEKSAMFEVGARSVLEKLLPVVDNFERGLTAVPESEKESATAVGMDKIYKQLMKALEELEVTPIEAVGKEFSPDFHNAVMQAQEEGVGENIVVAEFQKGYMYRDSVLRYSMVKVNQ
jgi:molecular chaperone GrpE